jgi:hypothetical protein
MMESSSKFLSLSGLSGVFAGGFALIGAYFAQREIEQFQTKYYFYELQQRLAEGFSDLAIRLSIIAIAVLIAAIGSAILFTYLKARKAKQKLITPLSIRFLFSLGLPLGVGGVFIIGLYLNNYAELVVPTTLLVYGMALLNASKYVHVDIKYLAICEMILGTVSLFYLYDSILIWAIGFGVLHILYGTIMYFKYDRK